MSKKTDFKSMEQARENKILLGKMLLIMNRPNTLAPSTTSERMSGLPGTTSKKFITSQKHHRRTESYTKHVAEKAVFQREVPGPKSRQEPPADDDEIIGYSHLQSRDKIGKLENHVRRKTAPKVTMFSKKEAVGKHLRRSSSRNSHTGSQQKSPSSKLSRSGSGRSLNYQKRVKDQTKISAENLRFAKVLTSAKAVVPSANNLRREYIQREKIQVSAGRNKLQISTPKSTHSRRSKKSVSGTPISNKVSAPEYFGYTGMRKIDQNILSVAPPLAPEHNQKTYGRQYLTINRGQYLSDVSRVLDQDYDRSIKSTSSKRRKGRKRSTSSRRRGKSLRDTENQYRYLASAMNTNCAGFQQLPDSTKSGRAQTADEIGINPLRIKNISKIATSTQFKEGKGLGSEISATHYPEAANMTTEMTGVNSSMRQDPPSIKGTAHNVSGVELNDLSFAHHVLFSPGQNLQIDVTKKRKSTKKKHKTIQLPSEEYNRTKRAFTNKASRDSNQSGAGFNSKRPSAATSYSYYHKPDTNRIKGLSSIYNAMKSDLEQLAVRNTKHQPQESAALHVAKLNAKSQSPKDAQNPNKRAKETQSYVLPDVHKSRKPPMAPQSVCETMKPADRQARQTSRWKFIQQELYQPVLGRHDEPIALQRPTRTAEGVRKPREIQEALQVQAPQIMHSTAVLTEQLDEAVIQRADRSESSQTFHYNAPGYKTQSYLIGEQSLIGLNDLGISLGSQVLRPAKNDFSETDLSLPGVHSSPNISHSLVSKPKKEADTQPATSMPHIINAHDPSSAFQSQSTFQLRPELICQPKIVEDIPSEQDEEETEELDLPKSYPRLIK